MRCYAQLENSPYAWQIWTWTVACMVQLHLKWAYEHVGIGFLFIWCTKFEFGIFPPKWSCMNKWLYEITSCNAMMYLENMSHKEHNAKRGTQFGTLDQKLWHFEVSCTLGDHLLITPQPFIRCSWSWTFWKWRERSSTFMLTKISFEASLMLESQVEWGPKTCHFWKLEITGHFPFWETFDLAAKSSI
jgi:hypothetical protein